ncbi:MAG: ribosome maturation factor RimP [Micromonosporaceae bacterium]|nr:ribosome maturation factor RimP [Micromonosporaceae bacterium]
MAPRSRATGRTPATRRSAPGAPPRPAGPTPQQREGIRAAVEPVAVAAGYDLEALTVSRVGRRFLVRVIVDRDAGVGLDAIAELSRAISAALDEAERTGGELLAGEYQLEVSSPGVDRPLTQPRHWRRNRGRLVKVAAAGRQITARITDADDTGVVFDSDPSMRVPYSELGPGRVQVEFHRVDQAAEGESPAGDLDGIDGVDDDDHDGDFRNVFDAAAFTRNDGVRERRGKPGRPPGVARLEPGSTGDEERIGDEGREEER